ncbi:hypothetical protein CBS101457_002582 [Exobasidium rhododendri]|nr:hypothetical protein CBS101457_002582 [Exobasidium rhododendri]
MQRLLNAGFCLSRVGLGPSHALRQGNKCRRYISTSIPRLAVERAPPPQSTRVDKQAEAIKRRHESYKLRNRSLLIYTTSVFLLVVGGTYAAVPLYRAFCSATGFSGAPIVGLGKFAPSELFPQYFDRVSNRATRRIRVTFNADHSEALPWTFKPSQSEMFVLPGETALAFFQAKNKGDRDITGIATYNVSPDKIAPYFAKIECFCFDEQKLLAGEDVDLPVFFFIDKEMLEDPSARDVREVVLSYSFFGAKRNEKSGQLEPDTDLSKYTVGKDL